ncbi:hypothetical protein EV702DRAFT_1191719 [Suillus placidus]|uniref:Myb/SANT-like domain-containing protein n=1 Tax=Suillus placidus TaxID=48579 RepID=A0A9P7A6A6_9AGAM|nr:hypothetical protein EV702DRAFT_1191719 [Suillus placidus]
MNPTQDDESQLIQYIASHIDRAKSGDLHPLDFPKPFWIEAATHLASQSTLKSADACQSKWAQIRIIFHVINKLANVPGLSYSLERGAGVTSESEPIWAKFIKNYPQAKPFKTKGWPHYETVQYLIQSKASTNSKNLPRPRRKNVFHDILHPTTLECTDSENKQYWDSMTKAVDAVEFGLPMHTTVDQPTSSRLRPFYPSLQPPFDPSNFSDSESESDDDDMYAPSVPPFASQYAPSLPPFASQHAPLVSAFEQLGENLRKLISALEPTPETSPLDSIPIRKQKAIVKVQKEDLGDDDILSLIKLSQADVDSADAYLAIEKDGVRKLYLSSCLKK